MAFHGVRLPVDYERGAVGGPRFYTNITSDRGGKEIRNLNWYQERGFWDVGYGLQTLMDYHTISTFFRQRQGRLHSFRFRDWSDYRANNEKIGTWSASGDVLQMYKTYGTYRRPITHPETVLLLDGEGAEISEDDYSVDNIKGLITFNKAPTGEPITISWTGEFDVPVRFDTDEINANVLLVADGNGAAEVPSIPIVEVKQSFPRSPDRRYYGYVDVLTSLSVDSDDSPPEPIRYSDDVVIADWTTSEGSAPNIRNNRIIVENGYSISMRGNMLSISNSSTNPNQVKFRRWDALTGDFIGGVSVPLVLTGSPTLWDMYGDWCVLSPKVNPRGLPEVNFITGELRWWREGNGDHETGTVRAISQAIAGAFSASGFARYSKEDFPHSRFMVLGWYSTHLFDRNRNIAYIDYKYLPTRQREIITVESILAGGRGIMHESAPEWGYIFGAITDSALAIRRKDRSGSITSASLTPADFGAASFRGPSAALKHVRSTNEMALFADTDVGIRMITLAPYSMEASSPVSFTAPPTRDFFYYGSINDIIGFNGNGKDEYYSFSRRAKHSAEGRTTRPPSFQSDFSFVYDGVNDRNFLITRDGTQQRVRFWSTSPLWGIGLPPVSHIERLDSNYARGAVGGPTFVTEIERVKNKAELRSADFDHERGRWEIGYGDRKSAEIRGIVNYFRQRRGRFQGFRFRDWSDFRALHNHIGRWTASGDILPLRRVYGVDYVKRIMRPVLEGLELSTRQGNAFLPIDESVYDVDVLTGLVTFREGPPVGEEVEIYWTGAFDLLVRFDTDEIDVRVVNPDLMSIGSLPIVELAS